MHDRILAQAVRDERVKYKKEKLGGLGREG